MRIGDLQKSPAPEPPDVVDRRHPEVLDRVGLGQQFIEGLQGLDAELFQRPSASLSVKCAMEQLSCDDRFTAGWRIHLGLFTLVEPLLQEQI